ncbi:GntR family transcriptional regulator [Actinomadura litoris]|uniref:GntR family transcriptional regulator n=1 Tax=Actinomadura litoris TaxID=2678616 RepID=UPI001FA72A65|nr:GntR family transcriptional regulator [Actinomadura litoris]
MPEIGPDLRIDRPAETVPQLVVRRVRQAILDGALSPGRRLTERELMELTGVSRTSSTRCAACRSAFPGRRERSEHEYLDLVAAITDRDADRAARLARRHVDAAKEAALAAIAKLEEGRASEA